MKSCSHFVFDNWLVIGLVISNHPPEHPQNCTTRSPITITNCLSWFSRKIEQFSNDCRKYLRDYYAQWLASTSLLSFSTNQRENQSYVVRAVFPALWFIALQYPVVIGRINYFCYWFFDSLLKTALTEPLKHFTTENTQEHFCNLSCQLFFTIYPSSCWTRSWPFYMFSVRDRKSVV